MHHHNFIIMKLFVVLILFVTFAIEAGLGRDSKSLSSSHNVKFKPTKQPPITKPPPTNRKCTRPHEIFACGSACQTTCETLGQTCPIVNIKCNDMCYCKDGYARDPTGTCIPISDCTKRLNGICGVNEVYKRKTYYMDECSGQKLSKQEIPFSRSCGCFCKTGYKRHVSGLCVPKEQCNLPVACVRPNEEYRCGPACQTLCSNLSLKGCPINVKCNDACYCKPGYARKTDDKSECIPINRCPKI